jgi:hypothetical protein
VSVQCPIYHVRTDEAFFWVVERFGDGTDDFEAQRTPSVHSRVVDLDHSVELDAVLGLCGRPSKSMNAPNYSA